MELFNYGKGKSLAFADSTAFAFDVTARATDTPDTKTHDKSIQNFSKWGDTLLKIEGYEVFPYGKDNNLPMEIQEAIFPNNIAPRTLTKKAFLLYGQGPVLYKEKADGKNVNREYLNDPEIEAFLADSDLEDNILCSAIDYYYLEGVFNKIFRNVGGRIGNGNTSKVEHIDASKCRLAKKKGAKSNKSTHVIISDWHNRNSKEYFVYPLFDPKEPTKHGVSIAYNKMKAFGFDNYSMPDLYGSLPWIRRASAIPFIIEAYTNNSLNLKFHIQSPQKYWDDKAAILKENATKQGKAYDPQELEDLKIEILDSLSTVLGGISNVGKFWHTQKVIDTIGGRQAEHGWTITPIDQKTKEYIVGQIEIAKFAGFSTTAGLGLHNALANVGADGKSDSGSEQLYALKNHQLTETPVPEMIVCKVYNDILKFTWPEKKIKMGFYSHTPEAEQNISPIARSINQ